MASYNSISSAAFAQQTARRELEKELERSRAESRRRHAARITGAHTTAPIKDARMRDKWLSVAKQHDREAPRGGVSWYLLVLLGFNTALRIGDLCELKVGDVRGRERVRIIADKTDKLTNVKLQAAARNALDALLEGRDPEEYILTSRQKSRKTGEIKPITRQRAYEIVRDIARRAGFTEKAGCHTMRKTFAWNFYKTCGDLAKLQKVLNHSSQEATIHYLGLDQQSIDETIDKMPVMV